MLSWSADSTCTSPCSLHISLSLTLNKPHLYPHILLPFFYAEMQEPRSSENTILLSTFGEASWKKWWAPRPTLQRVTLILSIFFLLHCQENRLRSVLRENSWETPGWDPALSAQQAGRVAEVGDSVCLPNVHYPQQLGAHGAWTGQATLNYITLSLFPP
jgi:hypothetical protein